MTSSEDQAPVIVCGLGHIGYRVVELLQQLGTPVSVITLAAHSEWLAAVEARGARVVLGDARQDDRLREAGLAEARALVIVTDHDVVNIEIALDAKRLRPELPIVLRLFDQNLARQMESGFDIRSASAVSALAAPAFAGAALGERTLGSFSLDGRTMVIGKHTVDPASPLAGLGISKMGRNGLHVVAHRPAAQHAAALPLTEALIAAGDQLFLLGEKSDWERLNPAARPGFIPAAPPRSFASPRRWGTALRRIWTGSSLSVRSIFVALNLVILLSVFVFSRAMGLSLVDALYFVLSTVTTIGYGDITLLKAPPLLKLYGCVIMLVGSATLATLYSMVTGYVVAERFQQLLGRRRIPEGGHVVVVGAGNLGVRTLEELRHAGAAVSAVDKDEKGDFVATLRATTPVVLGDARSESVLREAGVERAQAVVAVTGDDAVNLGVALLAKKLNPNARVVARLFDVGFARKVERALDVDVAMGSSLVAAPYFVASAYEGGVRAAFLSGGTLITVLECPVGAERGGFTPARLRDEAGLQVLRVRTELGSPYRAVGDDEELSASWTLLAARVRGASSVFV
ncbi:MAG: NAD-binding protein [Thermoanaerobaculia bacterium]